MKRYWVCSLLGHKDGDPEAIYDPFVCCRCGASDYYESDFSEPWHINAYHRLKSKVVGKWERLKGWSLPCSDCGRRFGRHDENVDHLPF